MQFSCVGGFSNSYLVRGETGYLLVDTGPGPGIRGIERVLNRDGSDLSQIRLILITHVHSDHVGGLAAIRSRTKAPVLVHSSEWEWLAQGTAPLPPARSPLFGLISKTPGFRQQFAPYEAEIPVGDRMDLSEYGFDAQVYHTPGHTRGSLSLVVDDLCVCGDTLFNLLPPGLTPPFVEDQQALARSWRFLCELPVHRFGPGHGGTVSIQRLKQS